MKYISWIFKSGRIVSRPSTPEVEATVQAFAEELPSIVFFFSDIDLSNLESM